MNTALILGLVLVAVGGLVMGSGVWPFKLMRRYQFEHWWLAATLVGQVILPWVVTLVFCNDATGAIRTVLRENRQDLIMSNLLSMAWGVANVLCGLCFLRIGVALTGAILTGIGATVGVMTPLLLKSAGMGKFAESPNVFSPSGTWVLVGLGVMLVGVVLTAFAGFGRDRVLKQGQADAQKQPHGGFAGGLVLSIIAGVLSAGLALAFVYCNEPIVTQMQNRGANELTASISVWALGIVGGVLVNVLYPVYLLTKNKSWAVFGKSWWEPLLACTIGVNFIVAITCAGYGMRLIGVLGAAVGIGIQQAAQILGGQGLGFISGEWRGVRGKPRLQMYAAIVLLVAAASAMTYGNQVLKKSSPTKESVGAVEAHSDDRTNLVVGSKES